VWNSLSLQNKRAAAGLPDGLRIYAIGDIHGRADLLAALLRQIDVDFTLYPSSRPIVVFIGDYIDRGPASREVLDLLLGCERTKEAVFLKGNHDTFVHRFLSAPAVLDEWRLRDFGVIWAKRLLSDRQRSLVEWLGVDVAALVAVKEGQVVKG
jgi:serine/threonine protein phosphatase 1